MEGGICFLLEICHFIPNKSYLLHCLSKRQRFLQNRHCSSLLLKEQLILTLVHHYNYRVIKTTLPDSRLVCL